MKSMLLSTAVLLAGAVLSAASIPRLAFEQIVRSSPRAVHGVVARSWSAWDDSRRAIWTHYEVRVTQTLRGPIAATFTISEPGGEVGDIAMRTPGAPRLAIGEEAVLFAYPTPLGYWRVRGWGQGRFRIEEQNGQQIVRAPQLEDLRFDPGKAEGPAALSGIHGQSLDSFLERARSLIRDEEAQ